MTQPTLLNDSQSESPRILEGAISNTLHEIGGRGNARLSYDQAWDRHSNSRTNEMAYNTKRGPF